MKSDGPIYRELYNQISHDIAKGIYPENSRLPPERDLCEMYKISRITVRQALSMLEHDGLIEKRHGRGNFVRSKGYSQRLSSLYSFTDELVKMGSVPGMRVLSCKLIPAGIVIAAELALLEDAPVMEICRLRLADGEAFAYETSYIPAEYLGNVTIAEIESEGLYAVVKKYGGISPDKANETFEAIISPPEVAYNLRREGKFAVMRLIRRASYKGKPLEYCVSFLAGDKYSFSVDLT